MAGKPLDEHAVLALARQNTAVTAIAHHLCVAIPRVKAVLQAHGVEPAPVLPARCRKPALPPERPQRMPTGKPIPLEVARFTFGRRLRVDEAVGGFFLDGRPVRFSDLMRRVNVQHVAWGQPQPLTAVPEWVVAENG